MVSPQTHEKISCVNQNEQDIRRLPDKVIEVIFHSMKFILTAQAYHRQKQGIRKNKLKLFQTNVETKFLIYKMYRRTHKYILQYFYIISKKFLPICKTFRNNYPIFQTHVCELKI